MMTPYRVRPAGDTYNEAGSPQVFLRETAKK